MRLGLGLFMTLPFALTIWPHQAKAQTPGPTPNIPPLDASIPGGVLNPLLKSIAFLTAQRPYLGAAGLKQTGHLGLEIGVDAILMRMPQELIELTGSEISVLPMARAHLAYGVAPFLDVAASGLWYLGTYFIGSTLNLRVWAPQEGPNLAIRANYNYTNINLSGLPIPMPNLGVQGADAASASIFIRSHTLSPQVILSKRLHWAEPYAFAGAEIATAYSVLQGTVMAAGQSVTSTATSERLLFASFLVGTGVIFRIPVIPLKIALEGAYSSLGMPTIGAQLGLSF